jgi:hypothetical protein
MNASDMRWLLRTIEDPETAKRFVVAQYQRARISYYVMASMPLESMTKKRICVRMKLA